MKCHFKHQRAYAKDATLWCPDCRKNLTPDEEINLFLRLLRRIANVSESEEQRTLEKEPKDAV